IGFVAASHAGLDVLRGMIRAADDDRILHAAGDEQLAILDETEVAGAQIAVAGSFDRSAERAFAALLVAPVPKPDIRTRDTNLANVAVGCGNPKLGIDNGDNLAAAWASAAHHGPARTGWATGCLRRGPRFPLYSGPGRT